MTYLAFTVVVPFSVPVDVQEFYESKHIRGWNSNVKKKNYHIPQDLERKKNNIKRIIF